MQTHLSYPTYHKLCQKFGLSVVDNICYKLQASAISENEISPPFFCIDMNVILSKEFIHLILPYTEEVVAWPMITEIGIRYYNGGMPAVEEYILSLI